MSAAVVYIYIALTNAQHPNGQFWTAPATASPDWETIVNIYDKTNTYTHARSPRGGKLA